VKADEEEIYPTVLEHTIKVRSRGARVVAGLDLSVVEFRVVVLHLG
jgi:hypothetical protein